MVIYVLLFILGLIIGSFLSVVVYRETRNGSASGLSGLAWLPPWVLGSSYCDHCRHKLSWYENIPLFSYLWQRGRCRYCKEPITISYPLVEVFTALEFVWIYWLIQRLSFFPQIEGSYSILVLGFWLFIFSISFALALIDFKTKTLPDSLILIGTVAAVLRLLVTGRWEFLLGGIGLAAFFLFLYLLTQGKGIGFGDVKLGFFIGVVLGWWQWILVAVFLAFTAGALVGIGLILLGKKNMKSAIAFGPFLLAAMLVAKIVGEPLWLWYSHSLY